jgi:hypothetical protein
MHFSAGRSLVVLFALVFVASCKPKPTGVPSEAVENANSGLLLPPEVVGVCGGNQLRVVWARTLVAGASDSFAEGKELVLMGADTGDSRTVRQISPKVGSFFRPLFLPGGDSVVYTDRSGPEPQIFSQEWAGGEPQAWGAGVAIATWRDPSNLASWVYALEQTEASARGGLVGKMVTRFRPEKPDDREIVWSETSIEAQGFQLSNNGKRAAALIPAPLGARLNLEDHTVTKLSEGTWPSQAGDDSYVTALLNAPRNEWLLHLPGQEQPNVISMGAEADLGGKFVWQPRWGNDPRYLAFSGGYAKSPDDTSYNPRADAAAAEIYLCRLNASADGLQSVVKLTNDDHGDYFPDVFVYGVVTPLAGLPQNPLEIVETKAKAWPSNPELASFAWEALGKPNQLGNRTCGISPAKFARYSRDFGMDLTQGQFTLDTDSAADWVTKVRASGEFTFEGIFVEAFWGQDSLSVRLACLAGPDGAEYLGLYRLDNTLVLRLATDGSGGSRAYPLLPRFRVGHDDPYHLVVVARGAELQVYINGSQAGLLALHSGGFQCWKDGGKLTLGDLEAFDGGNWMGSVRQFGLYGKSLPELDLTATFETAKRKMQLRRPTDAIGLEAVLLEGPPPVPGGNHDVLVPLSFKVQRVDRGIFAEQKVTAFFWQRLNGEPCNGLPDQIGASYRLTLEPLPQHPELQSHLGKSVDYQRSGYYSLASPNRQLKI